METLSNIIENDEWWGAEGTHKGLPLLIRFRPKLSPALELSAYPQLIQVYWGYSEHPSGMPSPEDSERMEVFENRLVGHSNQICPGSLQTLSPPMVTESGFSIPNRLTFLANGYTTCRKKKSLTPFKSKQITIRVGLTSLKMYGLSNET